MRRRQRLLLITALSSSPWVLVDSFVPPHAINPVMTGISKPDSRGIGKGAVKSQAGVPRLTKHYGGVRTRASRILEATAADAGMEEEEAEVVVIGSGIAGYATGTFPRFFFHPA